MSLETRIEELNTTIKTLIELLQSQQQPKPEAQAPKASKAPKAKKVKEIEPTPELPVESLIEEVKPVAVEPEQPTLLITKADVLEVAKAKLTEGKATKEGIKAIITDQGYESLNDITNQDDFKIILTKIESL